MEEGTPIVRREFLTTQWSVVLQARNPRASQAAGALEALCRSYWFPLYAHVRRQGMSPADAQDVTQAFFERLLERKTLELADRERQRLRGESDRSGKRELFDALHPESGSATESYESIGGRLGMSEGAVKLAAFRLRQRYRDLIREEVAQTVADPGELEDEIRHLLRVLGG